MLRQRHTPSRTVNNHGHRGIQKQNENSPGNKLKDGEAFDLYDRVFKIAVLKKTQFKKTQKSNSTSSKIETMNVKEYLHQND